MLGPERVEKWHRLAQRVGPRLASLTGHQVWKPDGMVFATPITMNDIDFVEICAGFYEADERHILRRHFRAADTVIEIGANIGVVSHYVLRDKLNPDGRLICVEPNPTAVASLNTNLQRSLWVSRESHSVDIVEAALVAPRVAGRLENFNMRANLSSGLETHLAPSELDGRMVAVDTVSLSGLLYDYDVQGPYSLICDAEGAEISMILEDGTALDLCEQMAIELHDPKLTGSVITPSDLLEELQDRGFTLAGQAGQTYYLSRQPV